VNKYSAPAEETNQVTEYLIPQGEVVIGELVKMSPLGEPMVDFSINQTSHPIIAISAVSVTQSQVGRKVVLMFSDRNLKKPIIIGFVHSPLQEMIENFELTHTEENATNTESTSGKVFPLDLDNSTTLVDGKKVVIEAKDEIVLKCGDASITLTKAGKIMIRGKYLLNRSTGVNRILGGSVQVN
jgi:hypothetical protein